MPPTVDLESLVQDLRESNRALQEQLAAISSRLPPAPEPEYEKGKFYPLPAIVYRLTKGGPKKDQIDHPGLDAKKVTTDAQLKKALEDGWLKDPPAYVYPPDEDPEPPKKGARR